MTTNTNREMDRATHLILAFLILPLILNAQETEDTKLPFIDRLVMEQTSPFDIDGIQHLRSEAYQAGYKIEAYKYTLTSKDRQGLGCDLEDVSLLFYESESGKNVLSTILITHDFELALTGNYKEDKKNKNKMLVQARAVIDKLKSSIYKKEPVLRNFDIIEEQGIYKENFKLYSIWETEQYFGVMQAAYNNWSVDQVYRDMRIHGKEGKETVARFEIVCVNKKVYGDNLIPKGGEGMDLLNEDVQNRLYKVLTDAANNVMEGNPYMRTLANDYSYIPEGLKTISGKNIEKYSWIPVEIGGNEYSNNMHVNIRLGKDSPYMEVLDIDNTNILLWKNMELDVTPAFSSPRINVIMNLADDEELEDVYNKGIRELYHLVEFLNMGNGNFALLSDKDSNLLLVSVEDESVKAVFKRTGKKEIKPTVKFVPPVIERDGDVQE